MCAITSTLLRYETRKHSRQGAWWRHGIADDGQGWRRPGRWHISSSSSSRIRLRALHHVWYTRHRAFKAHSEIPRRRETESWHQRMFRWAVQCSLVRVAALKLDQLVFEDDMHAYSYAANSSVLKLWKNPATAEQQLRPFSVQNLVKRLQYGKRRGWYTSTEGVPF